MLFWRKARHRRYGFRNLLVQFQPKLYESAVYSRKPEVITINVLMQCSLMIYPCPQLSYSLHERGVFVSSKAILFTSNTVNKAEYLCRK